MTPTEQAELVRLTLAGNKDSFVELVELHKDVVYGLARQNSPSPSDAEDIAQEAFLRAYRDLRKLKNPERFRPWLYGITIRVAREKHRRRPSTVPLDSVPEPAAAAPTVPDPEEARLLGQLATLPEKYRIPLTLHYLGGRRYGDIAQTLGVPESTARSLVHRARAMLLDLMEHDQERP